MNEDDEDQPLAPISSTSYSTFDDQISSPNSSLESLSQGASSENDESDSEEEEMNEGNQAGTITLRQKLQQWVVSNRVSRSCGRHLLRHQAVEAKAKGTTKCRRERGKTPFVIIAGLMPFTFDNSE